MNCPFLFFVKTTFALMMMIYAGLKILQWKSLQNIKIKKPKSEKIPINTKELPENPTLSSKIDSSNTLQD